MSAIQSSFASLARRGASSSLRAASRHSIISSSSSRSRLCTAVSPAAGLNAAKSITKPLNNNNYKLWKSPLQQYRSYSSQDDQLKQIGFEDINTRVTADPSSSASNLILIDVREPAELSSTGIIPGAVSVPLASQPDAYFLSPDEFETRFGFPKPGSEQGFSGKKKEIVFYCKAGVRARAAAQLAVQSGYDTASVRVYDGSWLDWMDKGGKVDKWEGDE